MDGDTLCFAVLCIYIHFVPSSGAGFPVDCHRLAITNINVTAVK